jgi:hypothetical protein
MEEYFYNEVKSMKSLKIGLLACLCASSLNAADETAHSSPTQTSAASTAALVRPSTYAYDYGMPLSTAVELFPSYIRTKSILHTLRLELHENNFMRTAFLAETADYRDTDMSILNSIIVTVDPSKRDQLLPAAQAVSDKANDLKSRIYAQFGAEIEEFRGGIGRLILLMDVGISCLEREALRQACSLSPVAPAAAADGEEAASGGAGSEAALTSGSGTESDSDSESSSASFPVSPAVASGAGSEAVSVTYIESTASAVHLETVAEYASDAATGVTDSSDSSSES